MEWWAKARDKAFAVHEKPQTRTSYVGRQNAATSRQKSITSAFVLNS